MLTKLRKSVLRAGVHLAAPLLWSRYYARAPSQPFKWKNKSAAVAMSFDMDLREDYAALPALLEDLENYGIPGTFGIIGKYIEEDARPHQNILDAGHEIMNHTYRHPNNEVWGENRFFNQLSLAEQREEIEGFERVAKKFLNYQAVGFRTPHFGDLHAPPIYRVLDEKGYVYSSSLVFTRAKSGGRPFHPSPHKLGETSGDAHRALELPTAACPEHFYASLDGVHCKRQAHPAHASPTAFRSILEKAVRQAQAHNALLVFDFGPQDVGGWRPWRDVLEWISGEDVWVCALRDAAAWWNAKAPKN